jgi:uncharacterized membrane protein
MNTPVWALSLTYWLHMLATVVWIGGLAALALVIFPAAQRNLDADAYAALLKGIRRRLDPIGWLSLLVLIGTGLFQMSANPNYEGFLAIDNRWSAAILVKHLFVILMVGVSAYATWGLLPQLERAALRRVAQRQDEEQLLQAQLGLQHQERLMLRLNLAMGVVVLALTALARAS